jgi:sugar phosphate isomerase/epimerase
MSIHLSCSTICFRSSPPEAALAEIRSAGFAAVDLAMVPGFCDHFDAANRTAAEREEFVELVRRSGLVVPTVTIVPGHFNSLEVDFNGIVTDAIAYLKLAALLDSQAVNINCGLPLDEDRSAFASHARVQAAGLKRIAQEAARFGLLLNVEAPHRNGLCRTLDEAEFLLQAIDEPNVRMLLDVTHVQAGGDSPEEAVRRFAGRIGHVHLRDGVGEDIFHLPGEGTIDFHSFFDALLASGYQRYCAVELEGVAETLPERRQSLHQATGFLQTQAEVDFGPWAGVTPFAAIRLLEHEPDAPRASVIPIVPN